MKKAKFDLDKLKVKSFVTTFNKDKSNTALGGGSLFGSCGPANCITGYGNGQSCIPEKCMAGITMEGEPGCNG